MTTPRHRDELVSWGRKAIARIQGFHASRYKEMPDPSEARFTFLKTRRSRARLAR